MNSNHAEYLTMKSHSHINKIAEDLMLLDLDLNTKKNVDRSHSIVAGFGLAKKTINYALKNEYCFDGIIDEFKIINSMRPDSLTDTDFLDFCDKNINYMKLWREFYSINEQFYQEALIENSNLEESEYDLVQYETQNYQAQINIIGIDIVQSALRFMNVDVPSIEIYSKRLLKNPLSYMGAS